MFEDITAIQGDPLLKDAIDTVRGKGAPPSRCCNGACASATRAPPAWWIRWKSRALSARPRRARGCARCWITAKPRRRRNARGDPSFYPIHPLSLPPLSHPYKPYSTKPGRPVRDHSWACFFPLVRQNDQERPESGEPKRGRLLFRRPPEFQHTYNCSKRSTGTTKTVARFSPGPVAVVFFCITSIAASTCLSSTPTSSVVLPLWKKPPVEATRVVRKSWASQRLDHMLRYHRLSEWQSPVS
jgi:hypothetical protein